jgi:gliding motility-associated-like protein
VIRAGSSDASLSEMKLNAGHMDPYFTPVISTYVDTVNNSNIEVSITPVAQDPLATITVNGTAVASGSLSQVIPLPVGNTVITTVVTAPDGVTTKTFTLTMTRKMFIPGAADAAFWPQGFETTTGLQTADDGILVHQAISPNGDGINDFLQIDNIAKYPENKLVIMNNSGQLIFEATNYDNSSKVFDGHSSKNGQLQLPGTYFYQLDYTVSGIVKHKTGFIVLKY